MAHPVKCIYCGHTFDRDKVPCVPIPHGKRIRYAHETCQKRMDDAKRAEEENRINLENYIKNLFNYTVLPDKVQNQINLFITENNYTYSGILKALKYFYEIKHGSKEKAYGRIGIVPFVYQDAHNYYLALWQTRQKNEEVAVKIEEYVLPTTEVHIPIPERRPMQIKRKLFTFLEELDNE